MRNRSNILNSLLDAMLDEKSVEKFEKLHEKLFAQERQAFSSNMIFLHRQMHPTLKPTKKLF